MEEIFAMKIVDDRCASRKYFVKKKYEIGFVLKEYDFVFIEDGWQGQKQGNKLGNDLKNPGKK